uniref:MCM_lid domain-containing protein n=1 Tax=Meloidogyne hapla TaxID=6305 RepID=A0A1I8BKR8_MELHA
MEEIRNARHVYEERVRDCTQEEQQAFDQTLRASVDLAEAYQISRRAKKRHIKYSDLIDQLDIMLGTGSIASNSNKSRGVVLPKLELKMFDGYEWENFGLCMKQQSTMIMIWILYKKCHIWIHF